MPKVAFHLHRPDVASSCVVFASPHSGRDYPATFLDTTVLDERAIRSSEDAFVDLLFDCAPGFGAPLLTAGAPRAFVDMNRSPDELDPALIEGVRRGAHNPRVASGLGVVPRVVANGRAIYRGKLTMAEAQRRVDGYWRPYHQQLQTLLTEAQATWGEAVLIDCHSMPHEAVEGTLRGGAKRPEIVIGDRFGASAAPDIVDRVEAAFSAAGFTVARNSPFAGAYTTQAYGRPLRNQHAIQIEIDRAIYLNEATVEPSASFETVRETLRGVVGEIADIGRRHEQLAAE